MANPVPTERIERLILLIRGQKVMLDADLAELYGVSVGRLNEAVRRNIDRFPDDFMFQLTREEFGDLRSQTVASNLKPQFAISSSGWGGRRHPPYVFTGSWGRGAGGRIFTFDMRELGVASLPLTFAEASM